MTYWIISDTHFNHSKKMVEIGRPENYEEQIFDSLSNLTPEDVLIHLGDICLGKDKELHEKFIRPLKCRKILVKGNHDHKSLSWYMEHGWDFACEAFSMDYAGKHLFFTHIPDMVTEGTINIHGHLHNVEHRSYPIFYNPEIHYLVSLEKQGYKAQRLDTFIQSK